MKNKNRYIGIIFGLVIFITSILITPDNVFSQFTEDFISVGGTGDLTISMGRYKIGTAIRIESYVSGGWAEDGGVYHIASDWNTRPVILYRSESSITDRLKFYGYVDPAEIGTVFLFATWDNASPDESSTNTVNLRITSAANFDINNSGNFSSSTPLDELLIVQANTKNVGIGTVNPTEKLTVNGVAKAEEVIVTEDVGADFVFEDDYNLPKLTEVESFIQSNRHLPEIPTAEQMKREGVKVGDLQMKLLQKIEELTLYIIKQEKKHTEKDRKIEELMKRIKLLEEKIH